MDISALTNELLQALGVIALAAAMLAIKRLLAWLSITVTASQSDLLNAIVGHGLDWAISLASREIATKGWDHPDIKSVVLRDATDYLIQHAMPGLKQAGIDTSDTRASARALMPILERTFSGAMAKAAASPATPITAAKATP